MKQIQGDKMKPEAQREAMSRFVHRWTGDHTPNWVYRFTGKLQFGSDKEWLANTKFWVTKSGNLSKRHSTCESTPTWPQ